VHAGSPTLHPTQILLPLRLPSTPPTHLSDLICQLPVLHEEVERLERLIVKDYRQEGVKGHRDKLMQNHRVRARLDQIADVSRKLLRAYKDGEDECEARREEISALGAVDQTRVFA
jgi:hypothetical protein